jgi:chemosensory pili system protein ChpB (putative protein-glutamate methylesterase)
MVEAGARPVRVLLLARVGEARRRLETAIAEAGAELLLAVDPAEGDPGAIAGLRPGAVLVALEPAVEDALERYEALLADPGVLVMFDEADVAAQRDGWDAARWVRHLAAKLNGHGDVLPPGAEADDAVHPAPGALPERDFDPASFDIGALAGAAQDPAAEVPRADAHDAPTGASADAGFGGLVLAEDMDWSSSSDSFEASLGEDPALAELLASAAASQAGGLEPVVDSGFDIDSDIDVGDPGDSARDLGTDSADDDLARGDDTAGIAEAGADDAPATVDPLTLGDGLSLADDDAPIAVREAVPAIDLDALTSRLDGLSLADPESYGHGALRGAVVVEAGLGGPDAVRQLLGGLGERFARAVLVRLQLDGGRYDRLVQQMQRATSMPVALAEIGAAADAGTVYFLPPDITLVVDRSRLVFAEPADGPPGGYAALPASDSALVFLSGASLDRVDPAMAMSDDGVLVLAQAPGSCYDAAAVDALVARGAVSAEPGDLAQALLDRWT